MFSAQGVKRGHSRDTHSSMLAIALCGGSPSSTARSYPSISRSISSPSNLWRRSCSSAFIPSLTVEHAQSTDDNTAVSFRVASSDFKPRQALEASSASKHCTLCTPCERSKPFPEFLSKFIAWGPVPVCARAAYIAQLTMAGKMKNCAELCMSCSNLCARLCLSEVFNVFA